MQKGVEVQSRLEWLGGFGKDPAGGVTRVLYSPEWRAAQDALKAWMDSLGLKTYYDEVGNLFGRLEGREASVVMTGSHVDTVKRGGLYDGQLGIIAGILALADLKQKYGTPQKTLEVVSFAEEEGSRFPMTFWGSKSMLGLVTRAEAEPLKDAAGVSFGDAIAKAGFAFKKDDASTRKDIGAFIEIHIEQGGVLEKEGLPLGVVRHIVGQRRFTVKLAGEANHAGTTPMSYRKDALAAAASIIAEIYALASAAGDPMVSTVGRLEVEPNISNVVPGSATFTIDARHVDAKALAEFTRKLEMTIAEQSEKFGVTPFVDMWMDAPPVPMDEKLVQLIADECTAAKLPYKLMHSGAGHDSQILAPAAPTAMIFVPSIRGISHSPDERTEPEALGVGLAALTSVLHKLAY